MFRFITNPSEQRIAGGFPHFVLQTTTALYRIEELQRGSAFQRPPQQTACLIGKKRRQRGTLTVHQIKCMSVDYRILS